MALLRETNNQRRSNGNVGMKVLGKIWYGKLGLTLEFYMGEKGTNTLYLSHSNKRFNLVRLFIIYASRFDHQYVRRSRKGGKPMWTREFEVSDEIIMKKFGKSVKS